MSDVASTSQASLNEVDRKRLANIAISAFKKKETDQDRLKLLQPHIPGLVTFINHNEKLPWTSTIHGVLMFADISGFTALCEGYSTMEKVGIDKLTRTLNDYLGALVECMIFSNGDILKFAGDAILCLWRVSHQNNLPSAVDTVAKCGLRIQKKCGEWDTDIGVKLTVKMGISAGEMSVTFIGNDTYRHYVELGQAVADVNIAESFCKSGYVVLSPSAWTLCNNAKYEHEFLDDEKHVRIFSIIEESGNLSRTHSEVDMAPPQKFRFRRLSSVGYQAPSRLAAASLPVASTNTTPPRTLPPKPSGRKMSLARLRRVVTTVQELNLSETLRLYVLAPVLQKLDDGQPLEYLSEMRQVSIVFMNMVIDSTSKDATEQLLQSSFNIVYNQSSSMHGSLNKIFLFDKGCTFLVIFGLPGYKHEQDCAHALQCASRMSAALDSVPGIQCVSIGVTTGTTFCGVVGHKNRHEYSVIGRKVNMAARLMMYYPGKVTCDDDTFQCCRLPATNFDVLVTKRMKGLINIGIIREFIEASEEDSSFANSVPHFEYPILGRETELALFGREMAALHNNNEFCKGRKSVIVYVGVAGIGKTRLLDQVIMQGTLSGARVISVALTLNEISTPFFVVRHILRNLLTNAGLSNHVDREPLILEHLSSKGVVKYLFLLKSILGISLLSGDVKVDPKDHSQIMHRLLNGLAEICLDIIGPTVFAIDDVHNADKESWEFLYNLSSLSHGMMVLMIRPAAVETPPCFTASCLLDSDCTTIMELDCMNAKYMCSLACQLLDVIRVPKEIDRLLRDRCQGIPAWCEHILEDMYAKKQILVVLDNGTHSLRESTVAPNGQYLTKLAAPVDNRMGKNRVRKQSISLAVPEAMKSDSVQKLSGDAWDVLAGLGIESIDTPVPKSSSGNAEKLCILAKNINTQDLIVPEVMKDMIIARLDSMRASEQLLVKCSAVLGVTFTWKMLEMILPKSNKAKTRSNIRRLFKLGIYECANQPLTRIVHPAYVRDDQPNKSECCCIFDESEIDENFEPLCKKMCFKNPLLQETAYGTLMKHQQIELHAKAAQYLESVVDELRSEIPYHILARPPPVHDSPSNTSESEFQSEEDLLQQVRPNRGPGSIRQAIMATLVQQSQISPLLESIFDYTKPEDTTKENLDTLLPHYKNITMHWNKAGDHDKALNSLTEAAGAAIALGKYSMTISLIEEAFALLTTEEELPEKTHDYNGFTKTHELRGRLERLYGEALRLSGDSSEAYFHLRRAGSILGMRQPTSKTGIMTYLFYYCSRELWIYFRNNCRNSKISPPPSDIKILEQCYCLSSLYQLHRDRRHKSLMLLDTIRQFARLRRGRNMHQSISALSQMINCCRIWEWWQMADRLEYNLLSKCMTNRLLMSNDDLRTMAWMYIESCAYAMHVGSIRKAIYSGSMAAGIIDKLMDFPLGIKILPILAMAHLFVGQLQDYAEIHQKIKEYAMMLDDHLARAWYYCLCMDQTLLAGFSMESFHACHNFACMFLEDYDVPHEENVSRYYISMGIALWYTRQGEWEKAKKWFGYWTKYEASYKVWDFMILFTVARKVECMLTAYSKGVVIMAACNKDRVKATIMKELKKIISCLTEFPALKPRAYHLLAYHDMLFGSHAKAKKHLLISMDAADKQTNMFESMWAEHSDTSWFEPTLPACTKNKLNFEAAVMYCDEEIPSSFHLYTFPLTE